jgi:hypothetical protein
MRIAVAAGHSHGRQRAAARNRGRIAATSFDDWLSSGGAAKAG